MSKERKKEPEQNRNAATINFNDYRITDPTNAPIGAVDLLSLWGGEILYKNYCDRYNKLVSSVQKCVDRGWIEPEEGLQKLEECRDF